MSNSLSYSAELVIKNRLGFHIRPIQRFAELARAFQADIEVQIEDRRAPGKSVMNLMGLRGQRGHPMTITARGQDAQQCLCVLTFLVDESFFVEDDIDSEKQPYRHLKRLVKLASCFGSDVRVELDGQMVDAKDYPALKKLGIEPTSKVKFHIDGPDAEQARKVLKNLARYCFYVEEALGSKSANRAG